MTNSEDRDKAFELLEAYIERESESGERVDYDRVRGLVPHMRKRLWNAASKYQVDANRGSFAPPFNGNSPTRPIPEPRSSPRPSVRSTRNAIDAIAALCFRRRWRRTVTAPCVMFLAGLTICAML